MRNFIDMIQEEYVVHDGALGTLLQQKGLSSEEVPEEWNVTHYQDVCDVHRGYLEAGAQIITTNTFGGSPLKLSMRDRDERFEELNSQGVAAARRALELFRQSTGLQDPRYVAASVGPSGKVLGMDVQKPEVADSFRRQGDVLASAGADLFLVETMMDLNESLLAVEALQEVADLPVVASMVFGRTKKGEFRTLFGNTVADAVAGLTQAGAAAVGVNCGLVEEYIEIISLMRSMTGLPLILYPNAGLPRIKGDETSYDVTARELIFYLDREMQAGATILGGCCGTTPEYTTLLAQRLKDKKWTP
jgi:5-methyltetrahydrofolate--homocysteine methyltransferase